MTGNDLTRSCLWRSLRLHVGEWHQLARTHNVDLTAAVASTLTTSTTVSLPPDWHGDYDLDRAEHWIIERDLESTTLLAIEAKSGSPVALVILYEYGAAPDIDVRLGYIVAEHVWGQGFASEIVAGLVSWAEGTAAIKTLTAGVEATNHASIRVLTKNGFALFYEPQPGEQVYRRVAHDLGAV